MNQNPPPHTERMMHNSDRTTRRRLPLPSFLWEGIWAIVHFLCCFLLQLSEFFAPLFLLIGIGWGLIPHIIGLASSSVTTVTNDRQARNLVDHVIHSVPTQLTLSGHVLTPHGLIVDGILLMIFSAAAATLSTWIGRHL